MKVADLIQDLRYAFRQFLKSPGFAIGAIVSLMLGIAATTTIFSVVYGVLLDPYPYKDPKNILKVQILNSSGHYSPLLVNGTHSTDLRDASTVDDVLFQQPSQFKNLTAENSIVAVDAGFYSGNLFAFLGMQPAVGRVFTPADARQGDAAHVAVLSYRFWKAHYFGNREVVGKTIELDHEPYTVIGVMTPRFTWFDSDIYLPSEPRAAPDGYWMAFARLKPGTTEPAAAAELQALVRRFAQENPDLYGQHPQVNVVSLNEDVLGRSAGTVEALFAAAVVLLLIGCANVSVLFLARGHSRQQEFAVRSSLGASRSRLVRQLLTESVLLSVSGSAFGALAAWWGVNATRRFMPDDLLSHEIALQVNIPVVVFCAVVGVITGIAFGLYPAFEISRPQLLRLGSTRIAGSPESRMFHRLPIAGQVALTLLLVAGAGGAAKAFLVKLHAPQGFDPDHVFSMTLKLPKPSGIKESDNWREIVNEEESIRRSVAEVPGVTEAGWNTVWDPATWAFFTKIEIQSEPSLTDAHAVVSPISPQLLSVLRIPLLAGRVFDNGEVQRQAHLGVVNQEFVKQYLHDRDPIGQSFRVPFNKLWNGSALSNQALDEWIEIVGVVADATNDNLDQPQVRPAVFVPSSFGPPAPYGVLYVRTGGDAETAMRSSEVRLRKTSPGVVVDHVRTLRWELDNWGWGRERLIAAIFALYAGIALVLAATGLYSVVSFTVNQRTHEFGIRIALGAGRGTIVRMVLDSVLVLVGTGVISGLIVSEIVGPLVSAWGGGNLAQLQTLLGAASILGISATIACAIPAFRAASIDPMRVLRDE
ncbi:MAG: ABC transporter permease [Candidatus Acidiferrales bacterium]